MNFQSRFCHTEFSWWKWELRCERLHKWTPSCTQISAWPLDTRLWPVSLGQPSCSPASCLTHIAGWVNPVWKQPSLGSRAVQGAGDNPACSGWGHCGLGHGHSALMQAGPGWWAACCTQQSPAWHEAAFLCLLRSTDTAQDSAVFVQVTARAAPENRFAFAYCSLPISAYLCQYVEHFLHAWLAWRNAWSHGSMQYVFTEEKFPLLRRRGGLDKD